MKALSVLIMLFQLVFGFSGLQNVAADQADKDYKKAADQGDQMAMIMIKKLQLGISE
jgi:hypothetical protein